MTGSVVYTKRALAGPQSLISDRAVFRMRMKNAALFAIGFLSINLGLPDSARCQTSLAPPLSLARPAPSSDVAATPPAVILASPPAAAEDAPPPRATAKRAASPVARDGSPPAATDDAPPPKPTAKRAAPPIAKDASPPAAADDAPPPRATAKRAAPPVARETTPPKPAADHDGFTANLEDEPAPKLPDLPRTTKRSKPVKEPDSIAGGPWANSAEDETLRRKLTICRDCK